MKFASIVLSVFLLGSFAQAEIVNLIAATQLKCDASFKFTTGSVSTAASNPSFELQGTTFVLKFIQASAGVLVHRTVALTPVGNAFHPNGISKIIQQDYVGGSSYRVRISAAEYEVGVYNPYAAAISTPSGTATCKK